MCPLKRRTGSVSSRVSGSEIKDDYSSILSATSAQDDISSASLLSNEWVKVSGNQPILDTFFIVTGLKEKSKYIFRTAAINVAGVGIHAILR